MARQQRSFDMTKRNQDLVLQRNLSARKITRVAAFVTFIMLCLTGSAAVDKLSDFKEAVTKENCDAIPYQSERITCKDRSKDKDRICVNFSCDKAQVAKDLETYKEKYQSLQNARSRKDEQSVRNLEETVKQLEEKLKGHVATAKERIDNGYNCLAAREYVQRSFSDAKQMVTGERDADLQQYIPDLVRKYEKGREEHIVPMQQTKHAIDNCQWVKEITW
jgi:recombinational DNA repair protein RecR